MNHCITDRQNNLGIMALCEVVLGNIYEKSFDNYITKQRLRNVEKKDSVHAIGKLIPSESKKIDSCMPGVHEKVDVP
jgi:hypothetical protein